GQCDGRLALSCPKTVLTAFLKDLRDALAAVLHDVGIHVDELLSASLCHALSDGRLAGAWHADQDHVVSFPFDLFVQCVNDRVIDQSVQEVFYCLFCLRDEHLQSVDTGKPAVFGIQDQFGGQWVVYDVQHGFQAMKQGKVERGCSAFWIHAHRGGVEDD